MSGSMFVFALLAALTIMLQWFLWLALTVQLFNGWGMAIGISLCAAQMLMLFEEKPKAEC